MGKGRDNRRREAAGGGPPSREMMVSKKLSWLLRHGAEKEGLKLGVGGYVNAADALNTRCLKSLKVTFDELQTAVATSDKQRFSLIPQAPAPPAPHDDPSPPPSPAAATPALAPTDPRNYLLRANQGHSLQVNSEHLLRPVELSATGGPRDDWPPMVVHGTSQAAWELILASGGLKRMGRVHVHFATGVTGDLAHLLEKGETGGVGGKEGDVDLPQVISGMRRSVAVLIFVDLEKALKAGLKFWRSENDVILSEGDEDGVVKSEFFHRVVDRSGRILMVNGEVIEE
ncbi:phosphotransferase KptA/Tpt1 [Eremomyces bilateralis CBS 781.70]|uniref:2'-phosphotransferase n=1 Tax=Eremomyces bilateralis CBS 781.70 TaxID=1392243 RepID=A0A6G1GDI6_9PEZI|nr:phosphotransferase KptA/Tpt1 [Eremomyces bilateralis CBS 781.70]KAF1816082.1 phosphotransferase KptA/Tpt1 [Eremomyces bilateralis CBS 781.70]